MILYYEAPPVFHIRREEAPPVLHIRREEVPPMFHNRREEAPPVLHIRREEAPPMFHVRREELNKKEELNPWISRTPLCSCRSPHVELQLEEKVKGPPFWWIEQNL